LVLFCVRPFGSRILCYIPGAPQDSNHALEVVRANLAAYQHLVTPGSYFVVQDTKLDRLGGAGGPRRATDEFLASPLGRRFERDRRFEYFVYSQHSGGFLRRREDPSSWRSNDFS